MGYTVGELDTFSDKSGITAAGAKDALPANDNRSSIFFVNISTQRLWLRFGANAAAGGVPGNIPVDPTGVLIFEVERFLSSKRLSVIADDGSADNPYTLYEGNV